MAEQVRRFLNSGAGQRAKVPVTSLVRSLGYELISVTGDEGQLFTRRLAELAVEGGQVLDIGANVGQYATKVRAHGWPGQILSVEPGGDAFRQLSRAAAGDPRWQVVQSAVGSTPGMARLQVTDNSTSSSLLTPTEDHLHAAPTSSVKEVEQVQVRTLDEVCRTAGLGGPYWLKLDVQGFELEVLAGAADVLSETRYLQCEISLRQLYQGGAPLGDLLAVLDKNGFTIVDIVNGFRDDESGDLLQFDVIAARHPGAAT